MRRLQKIFAALAELASEPKPSMAIGYAWGVIRSSAKSPATENADFDRCWKLVDRVMNAVVGIAEDNEKPKTAKADA